MSLLSHRLNGRSMTAPKNRRLLSWRLLDGGDDAVDPGAANQAGILEFGRDDVSSLDRCADMELFQQLATPQGVFRGQMHAP